MKGLFKPVNPSKYRGNVSEIVYRSSYELKLMRHLDLHPDILEWGSEEIVIPYMSPIDGRVHRYFIDFVVTKKNVNGLKETVLIEVKPKKQTKQPIKKKKVTKGYLVELHAWIINNAKWRAAEAYCSKKGWDFQIFTEEHLGIKYK